MAKFGSHHYLEKDYPAIFNHLLQYEDKLKSRGQVRYTSSKKVREGAEYPGQHHWLELDNNPCDKYLEDFLKQKIVWAEMTNAPKFVPDNDCMFIDNTEYFLTGDNLEYIVCILNSKLYTWLFDKICAKGMGARKWRKQYVEVLPIPKPDCKTLFTFNDLYKTRTESTDLIIEDTIAQMLHLTSQEKLYIRSLALQGFD